MPSPSFQSVNAPGPHPTGKGNQQPCPKQTDPASSPDSSPALAATSTAPTPTPTTAGAAEVAAEAIRYLNYAAPRAALQNPLPYRVTAELSAALYRLPQLLTH